jgi:hypothetical protein
VWGLGHLCGDREMAIKFCDVQQKFRPQYDSRQAVLRVRGIGDRESDDNFAICNKNLARNIIRQQQPYEQLLRAFRVSRQ